MKKVGFCDFNGIFIKNNRHAEFSSASIIPSTDRFRNKFGMTMNMRFRNKVEMTMWTKFLKRTFCGIFISLTILLSPALFTACKKQNPQSTLNKTEKSPAHKITVGFSIDTLAIERWQRDLEIFVNTVQELGANAIVQNAGNNTEEQKRQILYLLEKDIDVLVVLPNNADALSETIQKVKSKGIPVIAYDRLILNADVDLYMTINSEKVGELMGSGLRKLTPNNNWFCILGAQEDYNMTLILQGLKKSLKGSNVKLNHIFYTAGWNYDLSYQEMVRLIADSNIPDAIVCGNDAVAASVLQAIERYYPDKHIPICGQDADISACQYIVQGKQDFTIYKPITKLAEVAAKYAVMMAQGQSIYDGGYNLLTIDNGFAEIPVLWLEPILVNKDNMNRVIIESGFHNYSTVYGSENN